MGLTCFCAVLQKAEEKKIRQISCKITFHEARGGNRPGKVGDKRGHWSPNPEWDMVLDLKAQIELIKENARLRSWELDGAKKTLGRNVAKLVEDEKKKGSSSVENSPAAAGSPTSVSANSKELPPAIAI